MSTNTLRYHPATFAFIPRKRERQQSKLMNIRAALSGRRMKKMLRYYLDRKTIQLYNQNA